MNHSLQKYRESREHLLSQMTETFLNDETFVAAWLTGSYSRNDADAVSDLDLTVVISDQASESLCRKTQQISSQTINERLELFRKFGEVAILHENNNNAPEAGTFTFTLYAQSHLMVDWILIPQSKAFRPLETQLLFEKSPIPVIPVTVPESSEQRARAASERVAFFWMMMAITAKYLIRKDQVFVTQWLEELTRILQEVDRLIAGKPWQYSRGSRTVLEASINGQKQAMLKLGEKMQRLLPKLLKMGGNSLPSPMPEIQALLDLVENEYNASTNAGG